MANVIDCEFEVQSNFVHFLTKTLGEGIAPLLFICKDGIGIK